MIFNVAVFKLQQPLPFTVLKPQRRSNLNRQRYRMLQQPLPFTVLKPNRPLAPRPTAPMPALQQPLPFTVLKRGMYYALRNNSVALQQPLPFTVLKLFFSCCICSL